MSDELTVNSLIEALKSFDGDLKILIPDGHHYDQEGHLFVDYCFLYEGEITLEGDRLKIG